MPIYLDVNRMPPLRRASMVHRPFGAGKTLGDWARAPMVRRILLFILTSASTWAAGGMICAILKPGPPLVMKGAIICIFTVLFAWISISFWTAVIGFLMLAGGWRDKFYPRRSGRALISSSVEVAVIMPIYNEDVQRTFAGLQVMYESLQQTGQLEHFSFFVLSDSDQAAQCLQETEAWDRLVEKLEAQERFFYRHRKLRIHKKSGNVSDFCRRWGSRFKYMIPLDADSLMSGQDMIDMVGIMESRPDIGILQTAPKGINQQSLIARINQFASHLYGPLLLAGSYFWQLGDGPFWGHNAIVRLEPFMKFCALPKLAGSLPFGGEILSHDFIEAALMRKAGWGVWLAYDLENSFEELPPDLWEEFTRDRRWCRGNIQHLRLMGMKGISKGHRLLFLNGAMFYFSAFLWAVMLVLMTAFAIKNTLHKLKYFPSPHQLFPDWPVQYRHLSMELLLITVVFLFFPKILAVLSVYVSGRSHLFGGALRLALSVMAETFFSILLAPIRMVFHAWFVITGLLGGRFDWKKQSRKTQKPSWGRAFRTQGLISMIALTWALTALIFNRTLFLWLSVVVIPLFLSIPISMLAAWPKAGLLFKKMGLFLTPVEKSPSPELRSLNDFTFPRKTAF
ncbi:MAG: glucans biosynthesis glucosyltransferase MdoH [Candidatus Omnitrophica bacterium]|nr:glucans biosynthesis glucosyltransferase MdoH [Candidatus Omnitrophota bacterium]